MAGPAAGATHSSLSTPSALVQLADQAWSQVIELAPTNSVAWSNRGTVRLQFGRWQAALGDLLMALDLETKGGARPSPLLLNQLGNVEGSLGNWASACQRFEDAARSGSEIESVALANLALAYCQTEVRSLH